MYIFFVFIYIFIFIHILILISCIFQYIVQTCNRSSQAITPSCSTLRRGGGGCGGCDGGSGYDGGGGRGRDDGGSDGGDGNDGGSGGGDDVFCRITKKYLGYIHEHWHLIDYVLARKKIRKT